MLKIQNLRKQFVTKRGDVVALKDLSFEVPQGAFFTMLGPSGCGKTTTLRCIAGLEHPDAGEIKIGDQTVFSTEKKIMVPASQRRIAMVFQSYAIWPHMNVFGNVAYPLQVRNLPKAQVAEKVRRALEIVELTDMDQRPATDLSGGQQQRVALARAIVAETDLILLDEPLSNLDEQLRVQMRTQLKELHKRIGCTIVYVTHDQREALVLSDIIVVMNAGGIIEMGGPRELYLRPRHRFTASFMGSTNMIEGTRVDRQAVPGNGKPAECEKCVTNVKCPNVWNIVNTKLGPIHYAPVPGAIPTNNVALSIRPETIRVTLEPEADICNLVSGQVARAEFLGNYLRCDVNVGETSLAMRTSPEYPLKVGDTVHLHLPPHACVPVEADEPA
jgi:iron(III) transport system ATP-binding protein